MGLKTRDPTHKWDPKLRTLKMGPETWDQGHLFYMEHETEDTERGIWDTYDWWNPRPKANISRRTWDARTMIQMNLIKCPRNRVWVIIFLIFNHIIKRLQFSYHNKFDLNIHKTYIHFLRKHLHTFAFDILMSNQFHKTHRKPPVAEPRFLLKLHEKETLAQLFSCEFCETFKNTFL